MVTIKEPSIFTANAYHWNSGGNAETRRKNEEKQTDAVCDYLVALGFEIQTHTSTIVVAKREEVEVFFNYRESAKNVFKSLAVTKAGKRSNVTLLRKIAASLAK